MRWTFAGRDEAVEQALEVMRSGQSLVITGDAGVGKSRLARQLIETLDVPAHAVVRFGAAPALEDVPLGTLARYATGGDAEGDHRAGSSGGSAGGAESSTARLQAVYGALLEGVADEPVPLAPAGRRLVLLIDDVQWLDPLSAVAVAQLVVTGDALVLATRRTGLRAPEAIGRLRGTGECDVLNLEPFSVEQVASVLAVNLGPVERQTVHELHKATSGNALLLEDLVRAAQVTGSLVPLGNTWMWDGDVPTTAELNELIEERIGRLNVEQADALSVIAVGEPLPLAVARRALNDATLGALEREGFVSVNAIGDDDIRLTHPLYAEIVRSRMGPLERTAQLVRLVDAAREAHPAPDPTRIAVWCLDAGVAVEPADLIAASGRAIALGDGRLALRLAERALDAGEQPDALIAVGRSMALSAQRDEAVAVLEPLIVRPGLRDVDRVEAGLWLVTALQRDIAEAERIVDVVTSNLVDPREADLLRAEWAFALTQGQRWREAQPLAEELAASERDDVALRAVQPLVIGASIEGRCTWATDVAATALPRALGVIETVPEAIRWVFACYVSAGMSDGRLTDVQNLLDLAGGVNAPAGAEGYFSMIRGKVALLQGRPRTARAELEAALERLRRAEATEWLDWTTALLMEAVAIGDPAATRPPPFFVDPTVHLDFDAQRACAWAALASGDRRRCLTELATVADRAAAFGHVPFEVFARHDALRLGARPTERLEEVTTRFESRWAAPVLAHAHGRRDDDIDQLDAAATGFEELGAMLLAAECWATAARVAAEQGLVARARQCAARAALGIERCEGAATPGLELPSAAPGLTTRERRIAHEAAAGHRSRDIADGLGISVRTVDNLLGRVYLKLGVAGRDELAAVLGPPGD